MTSFEVPAEMPPWYAATSGCRGHMSADAAESSGNGCICAWLWLAEKGATNL